MDSLTLHSPAKINLMLSVHGRRDDGFHALTSLVAPLDFGDTLRVSTNVSGVDALTCSDPNVPTGEANLILRAAGAFRRGTGVDAYFDFDLEKRIPMGAGLGGGSSNAAVALKAMNELCGEPLDRDALVGLSAELGSDCPLFIDSVPTVMTGRGDVLKPLETNQANQIRGQQVVLFKPDFPVHTAWAYGQLIRSISSAYSSEGFAKELLNDFRSGGLLKDLLHNDFEPSVGRKYLAIKCLLGKLREHGHSCLMSGSGSCCFALVSGKEESDTIRRLCMEAWGEGIFFVESSLI